MAISVFELFKIGIGPSSSHTVGPMRASRYFVEALAKQGVLSDTRRVRCELYGSLGSTGRGHGSDKAVLLGLGGHLPDSVDVDAVPDYLAAVRAKRRVVLDGVHAVDFDEKTDLLFNRSESLPLHSNGMRFAALGGDGEELLAKIYYSVGGGFVAREDEIGGERTQMSIGRDATELPYLFHSGDELLSLCERTCLSIAAVMRGNERQWRTDAQIDDGLLQIWDVMQRCVQRGCATEGVLPGGYSLQRRAPQLYRRLAAAQSEANAADHLSVLDWVNLFALAVNEENAAGGRVVTAPTNGAAGIIPAVLHYYARFVPLANRSGIIDFLLTAGAIGLLYIKNASISGAEVGCQGEVGVACSMAAGALCAALGGTPRQVENAAEIGMEHHLGLTCDPVGGLVQIPCIERNAIAAVKAINAARMAMHGNGIHHVSLDQVIKTMRETGADMKTKYKETSRGGLALNVIQC
jgi:L-serine dehydratase